VRIIAKKRGKARKGVVNRSKNGAKRTSKSARKHIKRTSSKKIAKSPKKTTTKTSKSSKPHKTTGKFNLIVSFNPSHSGTAESELATVLQKIGERPKIVQTGVEGLFKVAVSDARKVVSRLRNLCQADPNLFAATHHYTPVDAWCKSDVSQMQKLIKSASSGISQQEKWKLGLNKRHWKKMEGGELIVKLTKVIDRENVDLDDPQKIVQVEIIGNDTGVSLLEPEDILDVVEVKAHT